MASIIETADQLLAAGRQEEAIAAIEVACGRGDVDALFRSAAWRLAGAPLPRDLPAARGSLREAMQIGHVDAALLEIALTANGSGGPASWSNALALLRRAAVSDPVAAAQLALVDAMQLNAEGAPAATPAPERLSDALAVHRFPALLSPAECAHVARTAADLLEPSFVVDPASGRNVPHPIRSSDNAVIGPTREDLVVRAINRRLAAISGTDIAQGEALTVLRYRPGQQYRAHFDALGRTRNERVRTVLVYLNEGFGGGETVFPRIGLTITPRGGDAIVYDNVTASGAVEPLSLHAGAPVTRGVKWLATRWIRQRTFDPWTGPEAA